MQLEIVVASLLLIIANCLVAIRAFRDPAFYRKCALHVDGVLINKQYARLISAGFVHKNWQVLFFNMFVLLCFALSYREQMMLHSFFLAYMGGLLGGNLLALHVHRYDTYFQSTGSSGALSGLITACLLLFPGHQMQLFFLPLQLPAWLIGLAAILYSLYRLEPSASRFRYEEHLGGMIAGGCLSLLLHPHVLQQYPLMAMGFMLASVVFLLVCRVQLPTYIDLNPPVEEPVMIQLYNGREQRPLMDKESELNFLLDEVARKGLNGLDPSQRSRLEELSQDPEI
ncbi:MAG: rhomboid family intramembrane serine protease [Bacteroidetes bacterium]|nr:MAG: rhomboid family intramembrane serine protease [Bacteroidota bacterium]